MAMEKEALVNKIEDDLAKRNRNWDKLDTHLADADTQKTRINKIEDRLEGIKLDLGYDLNDLVTPGVYHVSGSVVNGPISPVYGCITVTKRGEAGAYQVLHNTNNAMYRRVLAGGIGTPGEVWREWVEF